jgi:outer membrane lipoprotein-sorting protein
VSNKFGIAVSLLVLAASAIGQDKSTDGLNGEKTIAAAEKPSAAKSADSPAKAATDEKALDLLRQMEARYAQVQAVSGTFKQTRVEQDDSGFGGNKIESQAEFSLLKPNKFRADYKAPYESTNLITDDSYYRYTKAVNQVEQYKFQGRMNVQDLNYMLLGFGAKVDDITAVYNVKWLSSGVAPGYHGIQLTPRDVKNSGFKYITILITADQNLRPAQFSMEQGGARITADLDLKKLNIGGSVSASVFQPNWPKRAQVVPIQ